MKEGRLDFGIDAPAGFVAYVVSAFAGLGVGLYFWFTDGGILRHVVWIGIFFSVLAVVHFWGSKVGKIKEARRMIASIPWRGDEQVLDVGCGRGLLLVEAAKRLNTGKAVGVDIWARKDQSGNTPEATRRNLKIAGVLDRTEVTDGDARAIPFPDSSFDVVVSSAVIHNIVGSEGKRKALSEIVRVLKPGGRTVILDILGTDRYVQELKSAGMTKVERSAPRWLWALPVRVVSAEKPH